MTKSYFSDKILVTWINPRILNLRYLMKIEFNNLYIQFVFIIHLG